MTSLNVKRKKESFSIWYRNFFNVWEVKEKISWINFIIFFKINVQEVNITSEDSNCGLLCRWSFQQTYGMWKTEVGGGITRWRWGWHLISCSAHKTGPWKYFKICLPHQKNLPLEEEKNPDKWIKKGEPLGKKLNCLKKVFKSNKTWL